MTLSLAVLFVLTAAVMFSGWVASGIRRAPCSTGVLAWPRVEFSGLLDDLHRIWPLEEDECREEVILAEGRAAFEEFRRAA